MTNDEKQRLARYWVGVSMSTDPIDRGAAATAVQDAYKHVLKAECPPIYFFESPRQLLDTPEVGGKAIPKGRMSNCVGGTLDTSLAAGLEMLGEELSPKDSAMVELARHTGFCRFLDQAALVSDRPCSIKRNAEGWFHSIVGPAIEYRDGFKVYYVEGQNVPGWWVEERDTTDVRTVLAHPNADERALWCQVVTWERIMSELLSTGAAEIVDTDPTHLDPTAPYDFGQLIRADIGDGPTPFLKARCGTGRTVVIPLVGCEATTARAANAWSYDWDESVRGPFNPSGRS